MDVYQQQTLIQNKKGTEHAEQFSDNVNDGFKAGRRISTTTGVSRNGSSLPFITEVDFDDGPELSNDIQNQLLKSEILKSSSIPGMKNEQSQRVGLRRPISPTRSSMSSNSTISTKTELEHDYVTALLKGKMRKSLGTYESKRTIASAISEANETESKCTIDEFDHINALLNRGISTRPSMAKAESMAFTISDRELKTQADLTPLQENKSEYPKKAEVTNSSKEQNVKALNNINLEASFTTTDYEGRSESEVEFSRSDLVKHNYSALLQQKEQHVLSSKLLVDDSELFIGESSTAHKQQQPINPYMPQDQYHPNPADILANIKLTKNDDSEFTIAEDSFPNPMNNYSSTLNTTDATRITNGHKNNTNDPTVISEMEKNELLFSAAKRLSDSMDINRRQQQHLYQESSELKIASEKSYSDRNNQIDKNPLLAKFDLDDDDLDGDDDSVQNEIGSNPDDVSKHIKKGALSPNFSRISLDDHDTTFDKEKQIHDALKASSSATSPEKENVSRDKIEENVEYYNETNRNIMLEKASSSRTPSSRTPSSTRGSSDRKLIIEKTIGSLEQLESAASDNNNNSSDNIVHTQVLIDNDDCEIASKGSSITYDPDSIGKGNDEETGFITSDGLNKSSDNQNDIYVVQNKLDHLEERKGGHRRYFMIGILILVVVIAGIIVTVVLVLNNKSQDEDTPEPTAPPIVGTSLAKVFGQESFANVGNSISSTYDGKTVAIVGQGDSHFVQLYNLEESTITHELKLIGSVPKQDNSYTSKKVDLNDDGTVMVLSTVTATSNNVQVYTPDTSDAANWITYGQIVSVPTSSNSVISLSRNGEYFAMGVSFTEVKIYQVLEDGPKLVGESIKKPVGSAAFASSFSLSSAGNKIVIGAEGSATVYIFIYDGTQWNQIGFVQSENSNDGLGFSVSFNAAGDRLAVGAPYDAGVNGDVKDSGKCVIYEIKKDENDGSYSVNQLGNAILGANQDEKLGQVVSLSGIGDFVAISIPGAKKVSIYRLDETDGNISWVEIGESFSSQVNGYGDDVSLSSDGSKVYVGASKGTDENPFGITFLYEAISSVEEDQDESQS